MRAAASTAVLAAALLASPYARAQGDLPWPDANPLEGTRSHGSRHAKPAAAKPAADAAAMAAAAAAAAASVPTPTPEPPAAKPAAAPTAVPAAEAPVPTPAPEPPATDAPAPSDVPVPQPNPREAAPAPADAPAPTPAPPAPDTAAAPVPPADAPVPEPRPADAPAPATATKPGTGVAEPARPEDAPNAPEKLRSREPEITPAGNVLAAAAIEDAKECEAELKKRGARFEVGQSISEGECGVLRPVAFERSSNGIKVGPNTVMLCRTALALDIWLADSVVPAAKSAFPDRKLTEFRQASTYVCRPRASETGISEHARGSAIDIGGFGFDKGPEVGVAALDPASPEARFLAEVRAGACGPFRTVLGPGTDPDHATHFHLDIAARRNGATYCK